VLFWTEKYSSGFKGHLVVSFELDEAKVNESLKPDKRETTPFFVVELRFQI